MDEKTQELVNSVGQKVLDWAEATESFTVEQAPLLAQEIVRYGILNNLLQLAFFLIVPSIMISLSYRFGTSKDVWQTDPTPKGIACIISGVFGCFFSVIGLVVCSKDAVPNLCKALVAPRLYIIEQISRLM
ncbi:hypothetical protein LCGC14_0413940 [marine sediment metagenome]|uniref:Uncharacterized protein n=1 Tax=marine sediment metagenome TaxID=412755 RepID=A0A0F9W209_9ZZZZ